MKVVPNKNDTKKRKRDESQDAIAECTKRAKVHAQRKFAQGSACNSPSMTVIKDKVRSPSNVSNPDVILSAKRPNTEDFLTFLCFRRTSILPPKLDFFKDAFKDQYISSNHIQKTSSGGTPKNHITESAIKQSSRKSDRNEAQKKVQTPVQALRRKYQEQRLAKQNPANLTKLAQKVKGKNMIRTRSSTLQEEKAKPTKKLPEVVEEKEPFSGLRSGLQRTFPPNPKHIKKSAKVVEIKNLRSRVKEKGVCNKTTAKLSPEVKSPKNLREVGAKKNESGRNVKSPESSGKSNDSRVNVKKVEGLSDFSSDDNEPLLAVKKGKPLVKAKKFANGIKELPRTNSIKTRSQINDLSSNALIPSARPTRKTKEAAAIYMEMITKKLVSPEKSGDDDRSSVDSFPELPNAKRNEQRESEIKARALALKKGSSKEKSTNMKPDKKDKKSGSVLNKKGDALKKNSTNAEKCENPKRVVKEIQSKKINKTVLPKRTTREALKKPVKSPVPKKPAKEETQKKVTKNESPKKIMRKETTPKPTKEEPPKKQVKEDKKKVKEESGKKEEAPKKALREETTKKAQEEAAKKSLREDKNKKEEDLSNKVPKDEPVKKNPKESSGKKQGKEETSKKVCQDDSSKKIGKEEAKKNVKEEVAVKTGHEDSAEISKPSGVVKEELTEAIAVEEVAMKVLREDSIGSPDVAKEDSTKKGQKVECKNASEDEQARKEAVKKVEKESSNKIGEKEKSDEVKPSKESEGKGNSVAEKRANEEASKNEAEGSGKKTEEKAVNKEKEKSKEKTPPPPPPPEKKEAKDVEKEEATSKTNAKNVSKEPEDDPVDHKTIEETELRPSTRGRKLEESESKAKKVPDRTIGSKKPNSLPKKGNATGSSAPASNWLPSPDSASSLVEAPTFYPTEKEFQDPLEFFERIRPAAESFGLCRIVPPSTFKPDCKVSDDMRFTAYNQYVHRMFHRWGPNIKEMMAIKKYLATQSISLKQPPWIGGIEVDLPRLYQSVQNCGGLMKVMEKKKWTQVADMMRIPKAAQDRVTKLDDIYCKYLLPYDTLSHDERQKLFDEVESDWLKRQESTNDSGDEESEEEFYIDECEECIVKGRNMALNQFYRIARNTMSMWFKTQEPAPSDVENEFWRHVSERNNHVCVHSGSIDSSGWGYGFPVAKNNTFSRHPWNLKVLTNNSGSVLRSLGPVMGVTVPTLHVGMVFTAFCWYRDPHGLPWVEYLHTGAPKIWYGISDDNSSVFKEALTKLLPRYIKNKKIWLPSDTAMVPPALLVEQGVSLCHTIQKPGQFILVFPRAFTSSICTGYLVSESVYFAQPSWLTTAEQVFKDIRDCCEPTMFSLEKLLFSIATDTRSSVDVLKQVLPMVWHIKQNEIDGRKTLSNLGLKVSERLPIQDQGGSKKKKGRWAQDEEGDYECEVCRTNLCVSLVINSQEESVLCLPHAIELLTQKRHQLKYCKLMYSHTQEELCELVEKLEQKIESKSQKKAQSKSGSNSK